MLEYKAISGSDVAFVFSEALERKLHNTNGEPPDRSVMENLATGHKSSAGIKIIAAYDNRKLVAWATCTPSEKVFLPAFILNDNMNARSKIKKQFDWGYVNLGFISIFVDDGYRKSGVARSLFEKIEQVRLNDLKDVIQKNKMNLPVFGAKYTSKYIVEKYGKCTGVITCSATSHNFKQWNAMTTQGRVFPIFEEENGKSWKTRLVSADCFSKNKEKNSIKCS